MRILGALLIAISTCASAQNPPQPSGKFYGQQFWFPKSGLKPLPLVRLTPPTVVFQCAIPLVEMKLPEQAALPMATVAPPKDAPPLGWEAKSLLPPCLQR